MTDHRARLARTIDDVPGIHFNGLVDRLDLAPGQVQHHLRSLLRDDAVVRLALYGRTHFYPPEYDRFQRGALALCHRETARDILVVLATRGPATPASVADTLDIARSTLEWHLGHLVEQDLVEKRPVGGNRVELVLTRPTETVRLLASIQPALSDRLVDRFSRLVDRYLE